MRSLGMTGAESQVVITSYSIHYTKLYDQIEGFAQLMQTTQQSLLAKRGSLEQSIDFVPFENMEKIPLAVIISILSQSGHLLGMLTLACKRSATRYTSERNNFV